MEGECKKDGQAVYSIDGNEFASILKLSSEYFYTKVDRINSLNVYPVPDGDTGTNMSLTLSAAVDSLSRSSGPSIGKMADLAAAGSLMGARGNSGVILSQFFRGLARGLAGKETAGVLDFAKAFQYGVVMAYRAVSRPVEGTILTVAREMARGAKKASREAPSLEKLIEVVLESGRAALERTKDQLPELKKAGVVDAGGYGLVVFMEGCLKAMRGETVPGDGQQRETKTEKDTGLSFSGEHALTYNYCTEVTVKGTNLRLKRLEEDLFPLGDSLMVVGDTGLIKVHIHTNHPGEILEQCLKRGTLHQIKIDNMLDQHREVFIQGKESVQEEKEIPAGDNLSTIDLIAVANGAGLHDIFRDLGCSKVVTGGATMNPRVQDFVEAIREVKGSVIILPNDRNIRLAAEQAVQMVDREARVVPTRDVVQGIAAAMGFNSERSLDLNVEEMTERMKHVKSGGITYAVRDAAVDGLECKEGDIIGLTGGEVVVFGCSPEEVLEKLLLRLVEDGDEIISVIYGDDISVESAEKTREHLERSFPIKEIEVIYGGQPLYYYYISVE